MNISILENFKVCPAKLVLQGKNIFHSDDFEQLRSFPDYSIGVTDYKNGRVSAHSIEVDIDSYQQQNNIFEKIISLFATKNTLRTLMERATVNRPNEFLHTRKDGELETAVQRCKTVNFKFTQDYDGFKLGNHMENLDTIAWSQIYLGPTNRISGTVFSGLPGVETPEYQVPFIENGGYFSVNSMYTWHNVEVHVDNRRTLEIIWLA